MEGRRFACALGRAGIVRDKREGDGGTPQGVFALREVRFRPDRGAAPETGLPLLPIGVRDGWCDAPDDPCYNRPVVLPYPASAETLWREDGLYDLFAVIGFNDAPPNPGRGSAIFLHIARGDPGAFAPTEGCVALTRRDLGEVLALCRPGVEVDIAPT